MCGCGGRAGDKVSVRWARETVVRRNGSSRQRSRLPKIAAKITPAVDDPGDLNRCLSHAIENDVRIDGDRTQARHDIVTRAPHEPLFGQSFAGLTDISKQLVGDIR
jgi:hypothetical protein